MKNEMFRNYDITPESYIPHNSPDEQVWCNEVQKPFYTYNAFGEITGVEWNYGDTIQLEFLTEGNVYYEEPLNFYEEANEYLKDKTFRFEIINFRSNVVYAKEFPASEVASFVLTTEESKDICRGTYKCNLLLLDEKDDVQSTLINNNTIHII